MIKLSDKELIQFVQTEYESYQLQNFDIDRESAFKEITRELVEELEDLNSLETKQARLEHFKVKNANIEDYAEKLLTIDDNRSVLYGIRNLGGNPDIPFIQLRPNFQINSKSGALKIFEQLRDVLKVFKPLHLSFHTREKIDADFFGSIHMVSKVSDICALSPWPKEERITFESISDDSYHDWYRLGYEEFHRDSPELSTKVLVNRAESMEDSRNQGLLKFVNLDGERIGLISGEKSDFLGHSGVYFHEIFITKNFKGQGLAKAIQRKFVNSFCRDLEYVWDTIDSHNLPSFKTAFSNGRRAVRYECFVKL